MFTVSVSSFCDISGDNHGGICTLIISVSNAKDQCMHRLDLTIPDWASFCSDANSFFLTCYE